MNLPLNHQTITYKFTFDRMYLCMTMVIDRECNVFIVGFHLFKPTSSALQQSSDVLLLVLLLCVCVEHLAKQQNKAKNVNEHMCGCV